MAISRVRNENISSTISSSTTGDTTTGGWLFVQVTPFPAPFPAKNKTDNPHVPVAIYANEASGTVVVEWQDGTKNKVTCDVQDTFSVEVGFAMALCQKMFGGKKAFKSKWWKIIQRRIKEQL